MSQAVPSTEATYPSASRCRPAPPSGRAGVRHDRAVATACAELVGHSWNAFEKIGTAYLKTRSTHMPDLPNTAIADALEELGDLYELDGAIVHRVLAYRRAAETVREASTSVAALARAGRATELPGVGETLQEKIVALLDTGAIPAAERLRAKFPPGLIAITRIPGLGPKRARLLHEQLGIDSPQALREAAQAQRLRGVKGLGAKFEEKVLASLEQLAAEGLPIDGMPPRPRRALLPAAIELGEALAAGLREHGPPDAHVQLAGSARRGADSVKDIDLVAVTAEPERLAQALASLEQIERVGSTGPAGARGRTHSGLSVDLRIAAPAQLGNLLQHFTGSAAHNAALRELRGAQRAARLRVRRAGRRDRHHADVRDRGRGVRAARPPLHPAGAAREPRRARGRARGGGWMGPPRQSRRAG